MTKKYQKKIFPFITATLPESLNCVYFTNSGSEANDMAMMMAREYTGNFDIISFRNSYHGNQMPLEIALLFTSSSFAVFNTMRIGQ